MRKESTFFADCKVFSQNSSFGRHKTYTIHNNNNLKLLVKKPDEEELPLKCNQCKNDLNKDQPIQNCSTCKNLCNNCADNHAITKPNHKISLIKYDIPEKPTEEIPKCNQCGTDLKNDYKNCDNCDIPLCKLCGDKHEKRNPNHKVRIVKKKKPIYIKDKTGDKIGDNSNCISCNTQNLYYPIDGNPTLCKQQNDPYLQGYYFDSDYSIFKLCYTSCETCSQAGDSINNNCDTCKEDYFKDGSNCHLECPEDLFQFGASCVSSCGVSGYYLDLFEKKCTDTCPSGTSKNDALGLCTIERTSEYNNYDCNYMIENYILDKMDYYISDNSLIVGKNCYIQIYNSLSQNRIHNVADYYKLSKLFLNSDYLNINIIVAKIDYNQTYNLQPEVNDVKFLLYQKSALDGKYHQITNIDLISPIDSDDLIYIEKPFIYTENINSYQEKYKIFDIFNARDEIYNNFCIPFTSEYNTDVTYDFRRQVYFVNLTKYCTNDSTIYYSGFNSETISVQCKANYIENKFAEENVGDSRFKVFRCRSYLMNFVKRYVIILL